MKRKILSFFVLTVLFSTQDAFAVYPLPLQSKEGMVVSEHYLASKIGAQILKEGGNAIDAAVAMGYALAVTLPCCGNIGGGGFMLIHLANGKNTFINFREKAPLAAKFNMYLDKAGNPIPSRSLFNYSSVAVPGTVMGLDYALKKYGTLSRERVMQPAIRLAKSGFVVTLDEESLFKEVINKDFPLEPNAAAIFLKKGKPYQAGDRLIQTNLAKTLENIARHGPDAFYKGDNVAEIVKASKAKGGYLSKEDFDKYQVQELAPLSCHYRDFKIISAPPPSSGGVTLCESLNILEGYPLASLGFHSAEATHYMVEALRYAFADRNNKLGDPDFIKNPIQALLSKDYAKEIREDIQTYLATPSARLPYKRPFKESTQTTHFSVADKQGNLVAVTYTLNGFYGAYVMAGNTGYFLNNEMDDFSAKPGVINQFGLVEGENNAIQPGKRPLSSMTPTFVFKEDKPRLVLGSPGGPRIITAVFQTIINVLDYGMDIKAAVDAPRFHHQWLPDRIDMEKYTFSEDTLQKLAQMGYRFQTQEPWSVVEAIAIDDKGHIFFGAHDDRTPFGAAVAPDTF